MPARKMEKGTDAAIAFCEAVFTARPPGLRLTARPGTRDAASVLALAAAHPPPSAPGTRHRVLEGLALLWHDHGEEAHEIAQSREGDPDHDLLHAIFHRREGDHENADYWFSRAGKHPCYLILAERLSVLPVPPALRAALLPGGIWSAPAFNAEARRRAKEESPAMETLVMIQAEELRALAHSLFR
ncbi:MAG: hypothetical protein JF616_01485 [Fibrobacteres bacterium]|nr:hypothetical protein [Fibrobacterota bacterium]